MFNFLKRLFRTKSITRYLRAWLSGVIPSYWTSNPETELDANVGWTYVATTPTEGPNAGDTYTTGANGARVLSRTTYQWRLRVPAFGIWHVGARYALKSGRFDQTFAVNVNNAADKVYLKVSRQIGEPRAVFFSYTLGFGGSH